MTSFMDDPVLDDKSGECNSQVEKSAEIACNIPLSKN
jgi:hypothetical protein